MIRGNQTSLLAGGMEYATIDVFIICMMFIVGLLISHSVEYACKTSKRVYRVPYSNGNPTVVQMSNNYDQKLSPIRRPNYRDSFEV